MYIYWTFNVAVNEGGDGSKKFGPVENSSDLSLYTTDCPKKRRFYHIDNKYYYVPGKGNSNLTNETLRIESIKRY